MKIDFWKNYDDCKDNLTKATPLRIDVEHRTWWGDREYSSLDWVRINAYAKANNIDLNETPVNADFMNTMEEWYLDLAENTFPVKDMTNGEVLLGVFPPSVYYGDDEKHCVLLTKDCLLACYNNEWWNATYERRPDADSN